MAIQLNCSPNGNTNHGCCFDLRLIRQCIKEYTKKLVSSISFVFIWIENNVGIKWLHKISIQNKFKSFLHNSVDPWVSQRKFGDVWNSLLLHISCNYIHQSSTNPRKMRHKLWSRSPAYIDSLQLTTYEEASKEWAKF